MKGRKGRPIAHPLLVKTSRVVKRRHLREENKLMKDFSAHMGYASRSSVYDWFARRHKPITPQLIDGFIDFLKLDEFDALELRLLGAIENGWQIQDVKKARI